MKHPLRIALAAASLAAFTAVASAEPIRYDVDKPHTEVGFEVRHFFSKVHGRFNDFSGTIVFDDKDPSKISVDATAATASIWTDNDRRDAHLKTADFFDAEHFPTLSFKSSKVTPDGKNKFKIAGDLTMRGVTKPVVFDAEFLGAGAVGVGGQSMGAKAGFTATTTVNRKDWGINWNKVLDNGSLMLSDDVTIELNVEGNQVQDEKK